MERLTVSTIRAQRRGAYSAASLYCRTRLRSSRPALAKRMRSRLEASDAAPNLKTGLGGTYDIDFLAGRLQAEHQIWGGGNLVERIRRLHRYHLLEDDEYQTLVHSAEFLRTLEHFVRLVTGRPGKWLPPGEHAHECVAKLMAGFDESRALRDVLGEVLQRTRAIYRAHRF